MNGPAITLTNRNYALAVLATVYTLNFVDRGLMILLLQPIKQDLDLTDTQLGLVTGIAFALFYATLGLPIARWSDRGNRVLITSMAIGLWGLTVMACLFVSNFIQLVFARIAAAVGEAGCKPPTYSLVGDYFPEPAARIRAMTIYLTGNPLSNLVAFMVGGTIAEMYGWRIAFFVMGTLGLMLAAVVALTIRDPRIHAGGQQLPSQSTSSFALVFQTLWRQRSFRHLCIGLILLYTMGQGLGPWYAAFLMRSHGMGTGQLGIWLGLIFSFSGLIGVLCGGYFASRWFANDERAQMRMSAVTIAMLVPCIIAFVTVPQSYQALGALIPLMAVLNFFLGPTYALMQRLVADDMRATMMATVMLLANLIGMGVGPLVVGVLSDALAPHVGNDSLRYAMSLTSLTALWAGYHFWQVGRAVKEDLLAVRN